MAGFELSLVPQQMGVLLSRKQQVQPASIMQLTQSQQAWSISLQCVSPLVQVNMQPCSVGSHLHIPIVKLHIQTIMPLCMTQQLAMPPWSMVHRFCTMLDASLSSQVQCMRKPPVHFSRRNVHRGTIIQFMPDDMPVGVTEGAP